MTRPTTDLVMPKLGLTMTEGLLVEWCAGIGDEIRSGDVMFVVETDKVINEIEAPGDGVIETILVPAGETVPTGTPLARWTGPGLPVHEVDTGAGAPFPEPVPAPAQQPTEPAGDAHSARGGQRTVATPRARRLARQMGVDLAEIPGSGPGGRIKAADVEQAGVMTPRPTSTSGPASQDRLVGLGPIQAAMARRMAQAAREVPHFYLTADVVADPLLALRRELITNLAPPRLTIGHFIITAVAQALAARPDDNRIWEDGRYRVLASVDVGVAIAVRAGVVAPVLRNAGTLGLVDLAASHDRLVERARAGELTIEDMSGGAVTVSNLGAHGVGQVFPIINPPQSLILGVGTARAGLTTSGDGGIERQTLLPLVLGADHRVFDGANAACVLTYVSQALQQPHHLLRSVPAASPQETSPLES